ncbi:MAG: hypothetical protein ABIP33_06345 [Pseudolysinimonas sp.]
MPADNHWVALDVVAEALDVSEKQARRIAEQEDIRTSPTRPRQYLWADVVTTAHRRKTMNTTTRPPFTPRQIIGKVQALGRDKAIVTSSEGRLVVPWIDNKPGLGDDVTLQGTSSTGDSWTWIIIGPAPEPAPPETGTAAARHIAEAHAKGLEEAHGILTRRGGSYEAGIDMLNRAIEVRQEAGLA